MRGRGPSILHKALQIRQGLVDTPGLLMSEGGGARLGGVLSNYSTKVHIPCQLIFHL